MQLIDIGVNLTNASFASREREVVDVPPGITRISRDVKLTHTHFSPVWLYEGRDNSRESRFAAPILSKKTHNLSHSHLQADVSKNFPPRLARFRCPNLAPPVK